MSKETTQEVAGADDGYAGFLTRVLAAGALWTLKGEGGYVAFHDEEGPCFPFWSSPVAAQALGLRGAGPEGEARPLLIMKGDIAALPPQGPQGPSRQGPG